MILCVPPLHSRLVALARPHPPQVIDGSGTGVTDEYRPTSTRATPSASAHTPKARHGTGASHDVASIEGRARTCIRPDLGDRGRVLQVVHTYPGVVLADDQREKLLARTIP